MQCPLFVKDAPIVNPYHGTARDEASNVTQRHFAYMNPTRYGASLGGGAEVLDTRPDASTQTITSLHIGSFTDDCFLNLVQYKAGLAERLEMESGLVPTLLGSATNLGQVSKLPLYHRVALLYMVTLLP